MRSLALPGLVAALALASLSCTKSGLRVSLVLDNASGVKRGTAVEIAGVPVGDVEEVRLERDKARVLLRIDRGVAVYASTEAHIEARGLLGDKLIALQPGSGALATEGAELHAIGPHDDVTAQVTQAMVRVDAILGDLQAITRSLHAAVDKDGPAGLRPMLGDAPAKPAPAR